MIIFGIFLIVGALMVLLGENSDGSEFFYAFGTFLLSFGFIGIFLTTFV
jgi:hypothetical protein